MPNDDSGQACYGGALSVRDYFAAAVVQGVCSDYQNAEAVRKAVKQRDGTVTAESAAQAMASLAYQLADAMLAERAKERP